MNRFLAITLFFGLFLSIYLGMHLYVFYRLFGLFSIRRDIWCIAIAFGLALIFPLINIIEHFTSNLFTRACYVVSATWLGVILLLFFTLLAYEVVRLFVRAEPRVAGMAVILLVIVLSIVSLFFGLFPVVKHIEIPIQGLEKEMDVVHLSDLHLGSIHGKAFLGKVVTKVNMEDPDAVFITGDLFDSEDHLTRDTLSPLNDIRAPVFFSVGNHEVYSGLDAKMELLKTTKVIVLRNSMTELDGVQVIGIDDPAAGGILEGMSRQNTAIKNMQIDRSRPSILLYHPPSGLAEASEAGISLQLSGHTHAGQIFPFNLIVKTVFPRSAGLYRYGDMWLYVSTGTGTWGPPMRLGSVSEIAVIKLMPGGVDARK